jgi:sulfur-oxidizing protein SoxZ
MASGTIKIRTLLSGNACVVKALIKHEMETGLRKDAKTGKPIPAHFIQELVCEHNGKVVLNANWGISVAKNPFLSFEFGNAKAGDKVSMRWTDNKGDKDAAEVVIS